MQHQIRKLIPGALLLALMALVASLLTATGARPAAAADAGYRYWGVFQLDGRSWKYATEAPSKQKLKNKDVIGFRFAAAAQDDVRPPRDTTATYERMCGSTEVPAGHIAAAYVVDFGRPADSADGKTQPPNPRAACVVVKEGTTIAAGLKRFGQVRADDKGMICGIDDYPAQGCGDPVATLSEEAKAKDNQMVFAAPAGPSKMTAASGSVTTSRQQGTDNGPSNTTLLAVAAVVLLALAALAIWFLRRAKSQEEAKRLVGSTRAAAPAREKTTPQTGSTETSTDATDTDAR